MYAAMGGFVVDYSDAIPSYDGKDKILWLTLTPAGLQHLARHARTAIPNISKNTIKDKSKGDGLTKIFVCGQVGWFILSLLLRWAHGLEVALLEINTALYAVCALFVYSCFWWYKPLDIHEPTLIPARDVLPCANFFLFTEHFGDLRWLVETVPEHSNTEGECIPEPAREPQTVRPGQSYRGFQLPEESDGPLRLYPAERTGFRSARTCLEAVPGSIDQSSGRSVFSKTRMPNRPDWRRLLVLDSTMQPAEDYKLLNPMNIAIFVSSICQGALHLPGTAISDWNAMSRSGGCHLFISQSLGSCGPS